MRQEGVLVFGFLVEDITLHFGFLLFHFGIVFDVGILIGFFSSAIVGFDDGVDDIGNGVLLLLSQGVENVLYGFLIIFGFFGCGLLLSLLFGVVIGMFDFSK